MVIKKSSQLLIVLYMEPSLLCEEEMSFLLDILSACDQTEADPPAATDLRSMRNSQLLPISSLCHILAYFGILNFCTITISLISFQIHIYMPEFFTVIVAMLSELYLVVFEFVLCEL